MEWTHVGERTFGFVSPSNDLRDYFNPGVRKVFTARRRMRQVTVRFRVEERDVPALDGPARCPGTDGDGAR